MLKYIPKRIASRRFKEWQKMMGEDRTELQAIFPRLMLLGRNKRACFVQSLIEMSLYAQYGMDMKNMKFFRAEIRTMIIQKSDFSLEFCSNTKYILVVHFRHSDHENMTMRSELYDRIDGKIDEVVYEKVVLADNIHTIDLMSSRDMMVARFFYTNEVFVGLNELASNKCSLVSFYRKSPVPPTYACIELKRRRLT